MKTPQKPLTKAERDKAHKAEQRKNLAPAYVAGLLVKDKPSRQLGIRAADMPAGLIAGKTAHLRAVRAIREAKKEDPLWRTR